VLLEVAEFEKGEHGFSHLGIAVAALPRFRTFRTPAVAAATPPLQNVLP
jgi:hypothetical protein